MARLRVVETRLQQLETQGQIQTPDVVLKTVPAQPFLALREVLPDMDAVQRLVQRIRTVVPTKVGQNSLDPLTVVVHSSLYDPTAFDLEIGYLLTGKAPAAVRLSEERVLHQRELPAIDTLATLVHVGRIHDTHRTYGALANWIEQNQWQMTGAGREILMQLPVSGERTKSCLRFNYQSVETSEKLVK